MTLTDFHYYLPEDILTKVDRASMAVSLETRVPWLDHELAEFAFSLPSGLRIHAGEKKYLPKQLAKKMLPRDLPLQRKHGFCIPVDDWMREELGSVLEKEMNDGQPSLAKFLNIDYVRDLIARHRRNRRSGLGPRLFSVLVFSKWLKRFLSPS
jgi:asparagine synthase (glutamine-hydrolysing)